MPMLNTVMSAIHISKGCPATPLMVTGARLRPIIITTAPVTTGGMSFSIQRVPVSMTAKPIKA